MNDLAYDAEIAVAQLRKALDAFARLDVDRAVEVLKRGRSDRPGVRRPAAPADHLHDGRPAHDLVGIDLVWVAKAIERIGDHAKNIAEQVIYIVKGTDVRHNPVGEVENLVR